MKLRHYQQEAVDSTVDYLRSVKDKHPVIALPTGSGKSLVMAELIKVLKGDILILSHVKEILSQNYKTIESHTGKKVHIYSASLKSKSVGSVTVAGIQSAYRNLCADLPVYSQRENSRSLQ